MIPPRLWEIGWPSVDARLTSRLAAGSHDFERSDEATKP